MLKEDLTAREGKIREIKNSVLNLLIIENCEEDYQLILKQLRKFNIKFDPIITPNFEQAKNLIENGNIDIIISDCYLPEFSANDLLDYLKEEKIRIPVIIISGTIDEETAIECLTKGAVDYLFKDRLVRLGTAVERAYTEFYLTRQSEKANEELYVSDIALKQSEARFKELADLLPQTVFEVDLNGVFIFVNKSALISFGLREDELNANQSIFDFIVNSDVPKAKSRFNALLNGSTNINGSEYLALRKDKTTFPCHVFSNLVYKNGVVTGVRGLLIDITEQKKTELELRTAKEKAEEMNRLKSSFLANMSHELRTPMIGIMGYAELLSSQITDPGIKEMSDGIISSSKRLTDTLNSILDLSRIEANKIEVYYETLDVNMIIGQVFKLFDVNAQRKKLNFNLSLCENVSAQLDKTLLHQILTNLIDNAIKFTDSGSITIKSALNNSNVVINVIDTGIGISENSLSYIFDEFRQGSEGFSRKFQGSGLGLTITKKFVELLNGTIKVISEENKGTNFILSFPIKADMNTEKKDKEKKLLIVDDDPISRDLLFRFLRNDYSVDFACDGLEALSKINENIYSLILMDINLGKGMNGIEVTKKIRTKKDYAQTPIIALTAYAMQGDKEEFINAGCTSYISKPFYKRDLITVIETFI